jgi:hypothetical protein
MGLVNLGILPAAGNATRFGGIYKELLPIGEKCILERAVETLAMCDEILLVTNQEKIGEQARVLGPAVRYAIQEGDNGMWSAIEESFYIQAECYYFMMPDCVVGDFWRPMRDNYKFTMGIFETNTPERFGVIQDGRIIDKDPSLEKPATAWGVLSWRREVVDFWESAEVTDYTEAFNQAMEAFGYDTFLLEYYYDMASFEDYERYVWFNYG